jgi:hypothetical protein
MIKKSSVNVGVTLTVILFFILWVYLLLRIIKVPFLEDEIATWFIYIMHGHLLPMCGYVDANNHILNSTFAWIFAQFFDPSPEILRLPNFLVFPVYFYYSYKISQLIKNRIVQVAIFLSLVMTHSLFDFFGLCRGYGLSLALMMATGYHSYLFLKSHRIKDLVIVLISCFLMVWSHLSLLGTAYILFALLLAGILLSAKTRLWKIEFSVGLIVAFVIILGYSTWYSLHLQKIGKIYLGHDEGGFITVTVITLLDILFRAESYLLLIPVLVFIILMIAGLYFDLVKKGLRWFLINPENLFAFLFFGNIMLIFITHWILGIVYPEERGSLYLFPMLLIAFGLATNANITRINKWIIPGIVLPLFLIPVHFLFSLNSDYASAYHLESYPVRYIRYIQQHAGQSDICPIVGIYDEDRWVYDNFRHNGNIPFISENTYPDTIADFQIGKLQDNPFFKTLYDSLDYDPRNDFLLMQRKQFLSRTFLIQYDSITTDGFIEDEYFGIAPGKRVDSLRGTHFLYYFDLEISSPQKAFEGFIISSLKDNEHYEQIALDRVAEHWEKRRIRAGMLVREIQPGNKIPFAYFWNKNKVPFKIERGSLTIYRVGELTQN